MPHEPQRRPSRPSAHRMPTSPSPTHRQDPAFASEQASMSSEDGEGQGGSFTYSLSFNEGGQHILSAARPQLPSSYPNSAHLGQLPLPYYPTYNHNGVVASIPIVDIAGGSQEGGGYDWEPPNELPIFDDSVQSLVPADVAFWPSPSVPLTGLSQHDSVLNLDITSPEPFPPTIYRLNHISSLPPPEHLVEWVPNTSCLSHTNASRHRPNVLPGLSSSNNFVWNDGNINFYQSQPMIPGSLERWQQYTILPHHPGDLTAPSQTAGVTTGFSSILLDDLSSEERQIVNALHRLYARRLTLKPPATERRHRKRRSSGTRRGADGENTTPQASVPTTPVTNEVAGSRRRKKNARTKTSGNDDDSCFVCPYATQNPLLLEKGCWVRLTEISYLKSHLKLNHYNGACDRCSQTGNDGETNTMFHDQNSADSSSTNASLAASVLSEERHQVVLHRREDRMMPYEEQWRGIYQGIFPGESDLPSPYIKPNVTKWMRGLVEFLDKNGRKVLCQWYPRMPDGQVRIVFGVWMVETLERYATEEVKNSDIFRNRLNAFHYLSSARNTEHATWTQLPAQDLQDINTMLTEMPSAPNSAFQSHQNSWGEDHLAELDLRAVGHQFNNHIA